MCKAFLKIGSVSTEPGSKGFGMLKAAELNDGTPVNIPIVIINGLKKGPTLYLGAAIQGDEINGVEVIRRIVSLTDPKELAGTIIAVPIQNPLAFRARRSFTVTEYIDLSRIFPGNPSRFYYPISVKLLDVLVKEVISKADYVIDFHTGREARVFCIILPALEWGKAGKKAEELARVFGLEQISRRVRPDWLGTDPSNSLFITKSMDIPTFVVELGEARRLEEKYIDAGVKGVLNVMKHLAMIKGKPDLPKRQKIFEEGISLSAEHGGLLHTKVNLGDGVSRGELLAKIYNPYTFEKVEEIRSPVDGIVMRIMTYPNVFTGENVVSLLF